MVSHIPVMSRTPVNYVSGQNRDEKICTNYIQIVSILPCNIYIDSRPMNPISWNILNYIIRSKYSKFEVRQIDLAYSLLCAI